jgi:hypothetical protein
MVNYENSAGGHSTANERGPEQESTLDAVRAALGELAIRAAERLKQKTVTQGEILAKEFPGGNPQGLAKLKAKYIELMRERDGIGDILASKVGGTLHSERQAWALIHCSFEGENRERLEALFGKRDDLLEQMRELDRNVALNLVHCSAEAYVTEDGVQTKTTTYDQKVFPSLADATLTLKEDGLYVAEFSVQDDPYNNRTVRYSITSDADGNIIGGVSINRENKN